MNTGYAGAFDAQLLTNWTSEWGGGSLPKAQHGSAVIQPGTPLILKDVPGGAYDTFYQLQRMPAQNASEVCAYRIAFQFPDDAALALCQAVEFEIQRNDGKGILNGGVQFDIKGSRTVRTYDFAAGRWIATPIVYNPAWLAKSAVLEVVVVYDLTPSAITFRGLWINGVWHVLSITRPAVAKAQSPYFNFAFQLDCTAEVKPNEMWVPKADIVVI